MTPTKKNQFLINKYQRIVKNKFGILKQIRTQKDFDELRALALLTEVMDKDEVKEFYEKVSQDYYLANPILAPFQDGVADTVSHRMKNFSFYEQEMWELWYMYTFANVMNYAYNKENLNYGNVLENTLGQSLKKMMRVFFNRAVTLVREQMIALQEAVTENPPKEKVQTDDGWFDQYLHINFMWKTMEDEKVCEICGPLEGQMLIDLPEVMPHYNCRCSFVVFEWWTDDEGNVIADRQYDVEQNKQYKGKGLSVKRARITSRQLDGGEQITIFEVDDEEEEGKTKKITWKEPKSKKGDKK